MLKLGELYRERYRVLEQISQGGSAQVYLTLDEKSRESVAIKEYDSVNLTPDFSQSIKRHIELLSKINHPCVSRNELIEDEDSLKILMEYKGYTIDFLSIIRRYRIHTWSENGQFRFVMLFNACMR